MQASVFTFVCLSERQVATFVDVCAVAEGAYRQHAVRLLRDHRSAAKVEIWRDEAVLEIVVREDVIEAGTTIV